MLQKLREKTSGWIAIVIVGLIVVTFAFFGIENYFNAPVPTYVAKVGDTEISQQEYQRRFENYRQQMRAMMGDSFDARQFESPIVRRQFVERLVDEQLLLRNAEDNGLVVTAERLREEIAAIPAFQVDGQFSPQQYQMMLAGQSMSPQQFQESMRRDLLMQQIPLQVSESSFVFDAYVDTYLRLRDQTRDIDYVVLAAPGADEVGELDEADVRAWYEAHPQRFQREEQVTIDYVQLSPAEVEVDTTVDEATLRQRYEEQRNRFVEPGARLLSHILVAVPEDADADAQQAAQQEAAELAEQARAEDADFAALAREHSDDLGSRAAGGDLGWIERGFTEPAFEDAAFAMQAGEVSDPVKTAEGWHVIQVREVREETGQSFEEVRDELEQEYLASERERRFSDLSGRLVDAVYRDPTTLQTAAQELGLTIQSVGPFGRTGGEGIAAQPAVIEAAFSGQLLTEGYVSDPIDLPDGSVVLIRVTDHQPATTRPFEEVADAARAAAAAERREALIQERAQEALQALRGGETLQALAERLGVGVESAEGIGRTAATVDPAIASTAFALTPAGDDDVAADVAELSGERRALVVLRGVEDGDPAAVPQAQRDALAQQLARAIANEETRAYVDALRARYPVEIAEERL